MDSPSLKSVIASCHVDLEQLFFAHQETVLTGDLPAAQEALRRYTVAHDLHKRFEDEHLFPRLAKLAEPGDWPPRIYVHEHDKIDERLQQLGRMLGELIDSESTGTELRMGIITLLDQEKSYKGLTEHHQEREEAGMLPALDAQTDANWRSAILEPFTAEWQALLSAFN